MRMHPRRRGSYDFSARLASVLVNSYTKEKKKQQRINSQQKMYNSNNEKIDNKEGNIGCIIIAFVFIVFIIICGNT